MYPNYYILKQLSSYQLLHENFIINIFVFQSCLSVFKTPTCMDKQVDWCQIRFEPNCTQLVFKIRYVYGSTKTHFLPVLENEKLHVSPNLSTIDGNLNPELKLINCCSNTYY